MDSRSKRLLLIPLITLLLVPAGWSRDASPQASSSSSSGQHPRKRATGTSSPLDAGSVSHGTYRNPSFGFTCKIPAGWVLRTEEMNTSQEKEPGVESKSARVLVSAFSRPPEARGEDVNSSILIAAESVAAYPGLKDAAQYFGPVNEIAKAQGFEALTDPYEFEIGAKTVVRDDFQKDVGTRVMLQSTLVILVRGYAVSFTFLGGTEDEVEELVEGLNFAASEKLHPR